MEQFDCVDRFLDHLTKSIKGLSSSSIKEFLDNISDGEYADDFISRHLLSCELSVPSFFECANGGRLFCSIYAAHRNFLVFHDNGIFYALVQHHVFFQGVYFIEQDLFFSNKINHSLEGPVNGFLRELSRLGGVEKIFHKTGRIKRRALFVGYDRPYHYFYDTLPQFLKWRESIAPEVKVVSLKGFDFYNLSHFVPPDALLVFDDFRKLNDYLISESVVQVTPGYATRDVIRARQYDDVLLESSFGLISYEIKKDIDRISSDYDIVLWVGVCAEKRACLNLPVIFDSVISWLREKGKNFHVIFDGITSAASSCAEDVRCSKSYDEEIKLIEKLSASISDLDKTILSGSRAWEKIAYASVVDFYMTSFLTDSMYPSRFCRSIGVGHGANRAMSSDHVHDKTFFIPKEFVFDHEGGDNWSAISYAIDPKFSQEYLRSIIAGKFYSIRVKDIGIRGGGSSVDLKPSGSDGSFSLFYDLNSTAYGRINEDYLGFEKRSSSSIDIQRGQTFVLNFSCASSSRNCCTLHIIICEGGRRIQAHSVRPNESIRFYADHEGAYMNLFIRFQGSGFIVDGNINLVFLSRASFGSLN